MNKRIVNYYCIDINKSIDNEHIIKAFNIVQSQYTEGDFISVFDNAAAKKVPLYELELVIKHKTISELRRSLYGRRKRIVGFGLPGSKLAAAMVNDCNKICITNNITDDESTKFNEVIKL